MVPEVPPGTGDVIAGAEFAIPTETSADVVLLQPNALQSAAVQACTLEFASPQVGQVVDAVPELTRTGAPNGTASRKNCTDGAEDVAETETSPAERAPFVGAVIVGTVVGGNVSANATPEDVANEPTTAAQMTMTPPRRLSRMMSPYFRMINVPRMRMSTSDSLVFSEKGRRSVRTVSTQSSRGDPFLGRAAALLVSPLVLAPH
jgi:hypothetical protein